MRLMAKYYQPFDRAAVEGTRKRFGGSLRDDYDFVNDVVDKSVALFPWNVLSCVQYYNILYARAI